MRNILILGGTGFVGRAVCERLVQTGLGEGGHLTVPSRRPQRALKLQTLPGVRVVAADVHRDADLDALVAEADAVVNLVAILHGSEAAFEAVHVGLPRRLAAACQRAGVKRLVHVSALGVGPNAPSHYLRSKTAGEAVLRAAHLDLTVLRPSVIFGEEDRFLNLFASLQAVFPLMPLAGARARFQPVWVGDVAEAIVRCLHTPSTVGDTYELAGPAEATLGQLVRAAGAWAGHPRTIVPLPEALGQLQALAMAVLPGEPLMSRDNLASMRVPNVATGTLPGLTELGIAPASLQGVMQPWLSGRSGCTRLDVLRRH